MTNHIDLANCNMHQTDGDKGKSPWYIRRNITGETLHEFPPNINNNLMFNIIGFARKYELIAFNKGMSAQKKLSQEKMIEMTKQFTVQNLSLVAENERLATKLMKLIGDEADI